MNISTINNRIVNNIISDIDNLDHSLTHGKSGLLIILSHYYKYNMLPNETIIIENAIKKCIDSILFDIENKEIDMSLAFGFAGIGYSFNVAIELGQSELIHMDWIDQFNELVFDSLDTYLKYREFDYLRGASGIIKYIICYYPQQSCLVNYVNSLIENAIWIDNDKCYWIAYSYNEGNKSLEYRNDNINIGIAHGLCSIIIILSDIYEKGVLQNDCYKLISGAINFLLSIRKNDSNCQFPGIFYQNIKFQNKSRLGWCYGDSSVALSLIKAGMKCNNSQWIDFGNMIGLLSTQRNYLNAELNEHGICHGFFGIMHIYQRLYDATKISKYKETSDYWLKIGMQNRDFNIDALGFFQTNLQPNGEIVKLVSNELLLGLPGIYLCLSTHLNQDFIWDTFILTDIK